MNHVPPVEVDAAIDTATSVISIRPLVLLPPGRVEDRQVRVTAPTTGRDLPIVVFSRGSLGAEHPMGGITAASDRLESK